MFAKLSSVTRIATAFALLFVLSVGTASSFDNAKTPVANMSTTELYKYQSDHGGYGPEFDMPFMPGSN